MFTELNISYLFMDLPRLIFTCPKMGIRPVECTFRIEKLLLCRCSGGIAEWEFAAVCDGN
jgi:hypothetical protein